MPELDESLPPVRSNAKRLLRNQKVRCRTCERVQRATEVVVVDRAWIDPDHRSMARPAVRWTWTAEVSLACHHCIEVTKLSLLGGEFG